MGVISLTTIGFGFSLYTTGVMFFVLLGSILTLFLFLLWNKKPIKLCCQCSLSVLDVCFLVG